MDKSHTKNQTLSIAYHAKGPSAWVGENTLQIIKDVYRVLKKEKKFFNFQLSFYPLNGKKVLNSWRFSSFPSRYGINFLGIVYKGNRRSKLHSNLLELINMLHVNEENRKNCHYSDYLTKYDVINLYAKDYIQEYAKTHKVPFNELTFAWYFAIVYTCITYSIFFIISWFFYPLETLVFLALHLIFIPIALNHEMLKN